MKTAFVFPGQGSQKVGMGRSWAERSEAARDTFAEADDVLSFPLSRLCWEGPEESLQLTENTQPAILTVSIAIYRSVRDALDSPVVLAGHSLGEYSALVASGALAFADALRLVRSRGRFMQEAVPPGKGAMAAILGLESPVVERLTVEASRPGEVCAVANFNSPEQTVIAGLAEAVERAVSLARERGARRALMLPVSAPFHSPLMQPARKRLEPLLAATIFDLPAVPVIANVDAQPVTDGDAARDRLAQQVDSPVQWVDSVRAMAADFRVVRFIEVGPGAVLCGLVRRITDGSSQASLSTPETFDEMLAAGKEGG